MDFPEQNRTRLHSTTLVERLNKEAKRRLTDDRLKQRTDLYQRDGRDHVENRSCPFAHPQHTGIVNEKNSRNPG